MLEAGTEWWLANGTLVRPLLRAGAHLVFEWRDLALTASFESAPAGVGPFTINTKLDQVMGLVGAGLDVINGGDACCGFPTTHSSARRRRSTASASKAAPSSSYAATATNARAPAWACGARPA